MPLERDPEERETRTLHAYADLAGTWVLEIGGGEGRLTWRYAATAGQVVGLDPDPLRLAGARLSARAPGAGVAGARLPPPPSPPPAPRSPAPADKPPRAKRAAAYNHGRPRATPTEVRTHAYDACLTCAYPLQRQSVARRREVLDLPQPQPITVIEFQLLKRYCPACARWYEPPLDLTGRVVGQHRVSIRLVALIAWLRTVLRLPVWAIRCYLHALHQLDLSVGEIVAVLHSVAAHGQGTTTAIRPNCKPASCCIWMRWCGRTTASRGTVGS